MPQTFRSTPMFRPRLLLALLIATATAAAQTITEDFGAGFSEQLDWSGDLDAFVGEDGRLVLRDTRAEPTSTARVSFPAATRDTACWTLDVEQSFSASGSNRLRYWLAADRPLSSGEAEGYYFQFGGVSGADDALELFYADGAEDILVAAGTPGLAAADPLTLAIRVCVGEGRTWRLAARARDGTLVDTATGTGPVALAGAHVGLDVRFTPTRNGLLSVDGLTVGPIVVDEEAPRLVFAKAAGPNTVQLLASEVLAAGSLAPDNYLVGGRVVMSVALAADTIALALATALEEGVPTVVTVDNWVDAAGNASGPLQATITYTAPRVFARYDVLITEILADPTPAIGLPETEYVELYNASFTSVNLAELSIASPRDDARLPELTLAPGAYVALAGEEVADERFVVFPGLPTLNNGGTVLRLLSGERVVDEVAYLPSLFPSGKRDGGFSLERVDLDVPCALAVDNFRASTAISGGTPGAANAVAGQLDLTPLRLTGLTRRGTDTVVVAVNRQLSGDPALAFLIDGVIGAEVSAGAEAGAYVLALDVPLAPGRIATVTLAGDARSCLSGETVAAEGLAIGIAERATPGDWALSEIMYDPLSGQGRWVELANVSERLLSLGGLILAETDADGQVEEAFDLEGEVLVPPGGYYVVAADPAALLLQYPEAKATAIVEADVPTLGEEECLSLVDPLAGKRFFLVCYAADWHNRAFAKTDGVSLERIDLTADANDADNWTSAASTVGFATPTLPNSQARVVDRATGATLALQTERLSPDGDGFEDLLSVNYAFPAPGTLVSFEVVDLQGRSLFRPSEQEAVGAFGTWTWDGVTDEGTVAEVGTYVLRVEWWRDGAVAERAFLAFSVVGRR